MPSKKSQAGGGLRHFYKSVSLQKCHWGKQNIIREVGSENYLTQVNLSGKRPKWALTLGFQFQRYIFTNQKILFRHVLVLKGGPVNGSGEMGVRLWKIEATDLENIVPVILFTKNYN